jgi:hypothetical protein
MMKEESGRSQRKLANPLWNSTKKKKKLFSIGGTEGIKVCLARIEVRVSEEMNT